MPPPGPGPEFPFLSRLGGGDPRPGRWSPGLMWMPVSLVCVDLVLIGLDMSRVSLGTPQGWQFRVANDRSYGELFQYSKELGIGLAFLCLFRRRRSAIYGVWSLLFVLFLIDDALKLHEIGGSMLSHSFAPGTRWGLRAQDLGELAMVAAGLGSFLGAFVWSYRQADGRARSLSLVMLAFIALLGFFGIFGDLLHSWMTSRREWFAIFEDGGEMLAMSALVTLVYFELAGAPWRALVRNDSSADPRQPG